jgi:hypothetical protein
MPRDSVFHTSRLDFSKPLKTKGGLKCRYVATARARFHPHILIVTKDDGEEVVHRCDDSGGVPDYIQPLWEVVQAPNTMELWVCLLRQASGQVDWVSLSKKPIGDHYIAAKRVTIMEGEFDN